MTPAVAAAGTITPTDGVDEFGTNAGHCSLREAISAAQGSGSFNGCSIGSDVDSDTVRLVSGTTYTLSLPGTDDANANGDLDVVGQTGDLNLIIDTTGATQATIDGNGGVTGDRVIDLRGAGPTTFLSSVQISGLEIKNGAGAEAGGIREGSFVQSTALIGLRIHDNTAIGGGGGALRLDGVSTTITETRIDHNSAGVFGAIWTETPVSIDRSTIDHNHATDVGGVGGGLGIQNPVAVSITNSTIALNDANGSGGGIYHQDGGSLTLANATVAGNTADLDNTGGGDGGGGIQVFGGTATVRNSIIADNTDPSGGAPDCGVGGGVAPTFNSQGYNLIESTAGCVFTPLNDITGLDPGLGALADNGGPTPTQALIGPLSPAIDAANPLAPGGGGSACPATDQRALGRGSAAVGNCDIGAFELQNQSPVMAAVGDKSVQAGQNLSFTVSASEVNPSDTLTFSGANLPAGATISGSGSFSWTPSAGQAGVHPNVQFSVTDGYSTPDTETITIGVSAGPTPPQQSNPPASSKPATKKCKKKGKKGAASVKKKCKKNKKRR